MEKILKKKKDLIYQIKTCQKFTQQKKKTRRCRYGFRAIIMEIHKKIGNSTGICYDHKIDLIKNRLETIIGKFLTFRIKL